MKPIKDYNILVILFLLNVIIKSIYLGAEPLCHDEPFSVYHAQFEPAQLIAYLKLYNNPPLFELMLHGWIKVFGISELSVRFLPMLFSSASVVFLYLIGRDFFSRRVAVTASLLFTFSTMQIWYAHDSRVYSLFLLLTLASFYLFFGLLRHGRLKPAKALVLVVANVLLVYSHYFGFFVWFLQGVLVLLNLRRDRIFITFAGITACALLLYIPQILTLYERFADSATHGTWLKPPIGIESLYNMIWSFSNAPVCAVLGLALLLAMLVKYARWRPSGQGNRMALYTAVWFLLPLLLMFGLSYWVPMFLDRYLIFITPAYYLLLAYALAFLFPGRRLFYGSGAVLVICFMVCCSWNPSKKRAVRETVKYIQSHQDTQTLVLACPPEFMTTFVYYYHQDYFRQIAPGSEYGLLSDLLAKDRVLFIERLSPELLDMASHYRQIIYLDAGADFAFPDNQIKNELLQRYRLREEHQEPEFFHMYVLENTTAAH